MIMDFESFFLIEHLHVDERTDICVDVVKVQIDKMCLQFYFIFGTSRM